MILTTDFQKALSVAIRHCEGDTVRPDLQAIFLYFRPNNQLRMIGTNGHRMAVIDLSVAHGQSDGTAPSIISLFDAYRLSVMLTGERLSVIPFGPDIMFTDGAICESYPSVTVDDIPPWDGILNEMPGVNATADGLRIDATYLSESLDICRPLLTDKPTVRLRVADNKALFILPELAACGVISVTIAIMYKGGM
jgi:hypothetical protein